MINRSNYHKKIAPAAHFFSYQQTKINLHVQHAVDYHLEIYNPAKISRDSTKMTYWRGELPGSGKCACGMTNSHADSSIVRFVTVIRVTMYGVRTTEVFSLIRQSFQSNNSGLGILAIEVNKVITPWGN